MSQIPTKYKCDVDGCQQVATSDEAHSKEWRIVAYSDQPKYIAINKWASLQSIPSRLRTWHACGNAHAEKILSDFIWKLEA